NNQIENLEAIFNDEYDTPSHTKKVSANMRRQGKDFSGRVTPLFETILIQHPAEVGKDESVYEERGDKLERAATTAASLDAEQDSGGSPRCQDTILGDRPAQTRFERLSKQSHELPFSRDNTFGSREDRFGNYSSKEESQKVEKEEKVKNFITQEEDAEIQGRYSHDIEINTASTSITTASINITTVEPITNVNEDLIIAHTLMKMRSEKSKEKAKERRSKEKSNKTTTRPIVPPQQKLNPKDKGKGKMVEPKNLLKKKDQIMIDKEVARNLEAQLQAESEEEERLARQKEEEADIALISE
nr:hypothetical protein [Tanacetum cinerariifolium]